MNFVCVHAESLQSFSTLCNPLNCSSLLCSWDSPGENTVAGCHALFRAIFQTQGLKPVVICLLNWQVGPIPLVPPGKLGEREFTAQQMMSLWTCRKPFRAQAVFRSCYPELYTAGNNPQCSTSTSPCSWCLALVSNSDISRDQVEDKNESMGEYMCQVKGRFVGAC